jgi:hypothetical protein
MALKLMEKKVMNKSERKRIWKEIVTSYVEGRVYCPSIWLEWLRKTTKSVAR